MNREKWEAQQRERERNRRKRRERYTPVRVTWLDPPVAVGRIRIVGVCSDCVPDVAREYGVRLGARVSAST